MFRVSVGNNSVKIIKEEITATGDIGLYYPKSKILNLSGNVEIIENSNHEDNILIYCYAGISSQNVAQHFCNLGFKKIYNLEGGYTEFSKEHS